MARRGIQATQQSLHTDVEIGEFNIRDDETILKKK
jgi:hypothetical protein